MQIDLDKNNEDDGKKDQKEKIAACEDRTHDLRIMRPTLFQLSQSRSYLIFFPTSYKDDH